jgi:hypothetical protein
MSGDIEDTDDEIEDEAEQLDKLSADPEKSTGQNKPVEKPPEKSVEPDPAPALPTADEIKAMTDELEAEREAIKVERVGLEAERAELHKVLTRVVAANTIVEVLEARGVRRAFHNVVVQAKLNTLNLFIPDDDDRPLADRYVMVRTEHGPRPLVAVVRDWLASPEGSFFARGGVDQPGPLAARLKLILGGQSAPTWPPS